MLLLLMNVAVPPRSLPLQQAKKLAEAAWKAVDHGKDEVVVSDVLSSSANDGECVTKSFVVLVPKFLSDTKFCLMC